MGLCRKILVIEPYFGGSHKFFLQQLEEHLDLDFTYITLPARKWKWRMRFAAPWVARHLDQQHQDVEAVLCSTFVDVATLRGLAPSWFSSLPILTYFHENQFAYPVQVDDERDFHFGLTNYLTALASDRLGFNSRYNLDTFLAGCRDMEKKAPDVKLDSSAAIAEKSTILPLAFDFNELDQLADPDPRPWPVIVWNHRWEHDKNPELFFQTLFELADEQVPFKLVVVGQSFQRRPAIFAEAESRLSDRLLHFGYVESRLHYLELLKKGSVVVSTASHEFYGLSVIEAVRAGCQPLLPKRLSYPELFDSRYLYANDQGLKQRLRQVLLEHNGPLPAARRQELTAKFSWPVLRNLYEKWLTF